MTNNEKKRACLALKYIYENVGRMAIDIGGLIVLTDIIKDSVGSEIYNEVFDHKG